MPRRLTRSTSGPPGTPQVPENDSASLQTPLPLTHACTPRASAEPSGSAMHAATPEKVDHLFQQVASRCKYNRSFGCAPQGWWQWIGLPSRHVTCSGAGSLRLIVPARTSAVAETSASQVS